MSWMWPLEYSGEKDFEAKSPSNDEESCGLVMSAVGAGVGVSPACHVFAILDLV